MVDALASRLDNWQEEAPVSAAGAPFRVVVETDCASYREFARGSTAAPAQHSGWIDSWVNNVRSGTIFVTVFRDSSPVFAFGLEVSKTRLFSCARLIGGSHANGNFCPTSTLLDPAQDKVCVQAAFSALKQARPDINLVFAERLLPELQNRANPFAALPTHNSPNVALAADLTGGFQTVLNRHSGKRKRKRHRYQDRKLAAAGPIRLIRPKSKSDVEAILAAFFAMKSLRLKKLGLPDVFGSPEVQAFFRDLFASALADPCPRFFLDALEVDGKLRAVTGSSRLGDRIICDFSGFEDDELAAASPGEYLLHENIAAACREGGAIYDLGVGDEPYKRNWCNIETQHLDLLYPLDARGRVAALALGATSRVKTTIKNSPLAWRLVRAARSRNTAAEHDDS